VANVVWKPWGVSVRAPSRSPALFTGTSMQGWRADSAAAPARTKSRSERSKTASSTRRLPVRATTRPTASSPRTRSRAVSTVIAPIAAKAAAVASPMPELAPVTTTVVPSSAEAARCRSQEAMELGRHALARSDGAVHVPGPHRGRLGAGPVDAPARVSQGRAELAERARRERGAVAPTAPALGRPLQLDVVKRCAGAWPEETCETARHRLPALVGSHVGQLAGMGALEEGQEDARGPDGGELSKVSCTGPTSSVTWPVRPSPRQNGSS